MKTLFLIPLLGLIFAVGMSFTTLKNNVEKTDNLANDYVLQNGSWVAISEQDCPTGEKTCRVQFGENGPIFDVYDEMDIKTKKRNVTDEPTVIPAP